MIPRDDLFAHKDAESMLEIVLHLGVSRPFQKRCRAQRTSASVRARAIESRALLSKPSVPIAVIKRCMFGVKRNGTASLFAKSGRSDGKPYASISVHQVFTYQIGKDSLVNISDV